MDELKNCPFCGGEAVIIDEVSGRPEDKEPVFWAECLRCEISTKFKAFKEGAITAWNTRA